MVTPVRNGLGEEEERDEDERPPLEELAEGEGPEHGLSIPGDVRRGIRNPRRPATGKPVGPDRTQPWRGARDER